MTDQEKRNEMVKVAQQRIVQLEKNSPQFKNPNPPTDTEKKALMAHTTLQQTGIK
jgi:hypothetical protein